MTLSDPQQFFSQGWTTRANCPQNFLLQHLRREQEQDVLLLQNKVVDASKRMAELGSLLFREANRFGRCAFLQHLKTKHLSIRKQMKLLYLH